MHWPRANAARAHAVAVLAATRPQRPIQVLVRTHAPRPWRRALRARRRRPAPPPSPWLPRWPWPASGSVGTRTWRPARVTARPGAEEGWIGNTSVDAFPPPPPAQCFWRHLACLRIVARHAFHAMECLDKLDSSALERLVDGGRLGTVQGVRFIPRLGRVDHEVHLHERGAPPLPCARSAISTSGNERPRVPRRRVSGPGLSVGRAHHHLALNRRAQRDGRKLV